MKTSYSMYGVVLALAVLVCLPILSAQEEAVPKGPKVTAIPGGYFIDWPALTPVSGFQLKGPLSGSFEVMFDIRQEDINKKPSPPQNPDILLPLADYWIVRGKPDRAIPLYQRGLAAEPDNFTFQNNLAILLSQVQNDHEGALKIIDKAMETRLDNVTLLDTKGIIFMNAGRQEEAIPVLERAVTLSCQGPVYMMHLAQALDMDGQETRARDWFDRARPLLEGTSSKLSKENKEMFDALKMKYGASEK